MRNGSWMLVLLAGCALRADGLCDEAVAIEEQQLCVDDAADLARRDVDDQLEIEIDEARDWLLEDLSDTADTCRRAIDAIAEETREALARADRRGERRRLVNAALEELDALVERCRADLEEEGSREEDQRTGRTTSP